MTICAIVFIDVSVKIRGVVMKNIFFEDNQEFTLDDYMCYGKDGRGNLGDHISIVT